MFLLVSVRHVGAHPDELQHGVSIQSSINLGKTFLRISRIRIIPSTQILAKVFVYLPPFISKILDFICRMVLIFILTYFEWRDTENQQCSLEYRRTSDSNPRKVCEGCLAQGRKTFLRPWDPFLERPGNVSARARRQILKSRPVE